MTSDATDQGKRRPHDRFEPHEIRPGGSTAAGGVVQYRLDKVARVAALKGRWLDCGCCDGDYTVSLLKHGVDTATGTDIDPDRIRSAKRRWPGVNAEFLAAAAESLPFPDQHFDGVLLNEVLEHVQDQEHTLAELRRVLAPGGLLVVFSPNRWLPFEGHGMVVGAHNIGSPVPLLPWLPRRLTLPVMKARNYWPHELQTLVAHAGLEVFHLDFALPLFSHYRWLPESAIRHYQANLPRLERSPLFRRFGVSTLVIARRLTDG